MNYRVVTRDEWLAERKALLIKEKALTRAQDALNAERQQLPMVKVDKEYVFDTTTGRRRLADLFDGRSQLVIYHFMMAPDWAEGCASCSLLADHIDGSLVHLAHRDVTVAVASRAPLANIEAFKRRMGWGFTWVSSCGNDFNHDYHVSFSAEEVAGGTSYYNFAATPFPLEEAPGLSVFYRNATGEVFHSYSTYARGAESIIGAYRYLDLVPKGRDEQGLAFTMSWVRHHDKYGPGYAVDPARLYEPPARIAACCASHAQAASSQPVSADVN
jgi:predicted dithiol-disulfide oxidoreductase (DUF899 family)